MVKKNRVPVIAPGFGKELGTEEEEDGAKSFIFKISYGISANS